MKLFLDPATYFYISLQKLDKARVVLQRLVGMGSEREAHDALQNAVCRDKATHDDILLGLLASILTDVNSASKVFKKCKSIG
jgi:integrator complex subunit 3